MMTKPVYEYVKGQGWVANSTFSEILTMSCGTRVTIELRAPEVGECYNCHTEDTRENLILRIQQGYRWVLVQVMTEHEKEYRSRNPSMYPYVVFRKLD